LSGVVRRPSTVTGIAPEALIVVLAAAVFAFAANEVSPRGLKLARNYFPGGTNQTAAPAPARNSRPQVSRPQVVAEETNQEPGFEGAYQRLKDKGLQPISRAKTAALAHDPRFQEGLIVLVDARNEEHYDDGHIPGAYQLDPYHPEQQMANVLAACQAADQVVVYCTGGDCEDGDSTAILLRDAGVPNQKVFVYGGGYIDWTANQLPIEKGARNTGVIEGDWK
jgi:rhodanese-related sulfurtransferase